MTDFEKGDAWNDTGSNHSSISKTEDESVEGDFCILNEALHFDEGIAVCDVVSFLQAIQAVPSDKITEMCGQFHEEDSKEETISFSVLHNLIKGFAKEFRNSFSNDDDDSDDREEAIDVEGNPGLSITTGNLEGCGGDVSLFEPDLIEITLKNKNLQYCNTNLREENKQLQKQLDACDEECESQRKTIASLDKNIKQYQGNMSEVGQLITEKDEMLAKIQKCEAEIVNLRHKNKVVKEEADEYRSRLMCLQNQYDKTTLTLDHLRKENFDALQENSDLKEACDRYQVEMDSKKLLLEEKIKECSDLHDRIEDYENTIEELREEKDALLNQVREVQLEYSICQKAVNSSAPTTPAKSSIQQELKQAENGIGLSEQPSPLCGTDYLKNSQHSPMTENLRKCIATSLLHSPSSPRIISIQDEGDRDYEKPDSTTSSKEDKFTQTREADECQKTDGGNQTEAKITEETSTQAQISNLDVYVQTEALCEKPSRPMNAGVIDEENKMFEKESHFIQDNIDQMIEKLNEHEKKNNELEISLDREKSKSRYLTTQLGMNRSRMQDLQEHLGKQQKKIAELVNMNVNLCSSKLDTWWKDTCKPNVLQSDVETTCVPFNIPADLDFLSGCGISEQNEPSPLIDALSLDYYTKKAPKKSELIRQDESNFLHGQVTENAAILKEHESETCDMLLLVMRADKRTFHSRWQVLERCRDIVKEAIDCKVDLVKDYINHILGSTDDGSGSCLDEKLNSFVCGHLKSLQILVEKMEKIFYSIGSAQQEEKLQSAIEVLSDKLNRVEKKFQTAQGKLQQLFHLSLNCQCFTAVEMLKVLQNINHVGENEDENRMLHSRRVNELLSLSNPFFLKQIYEYNKKLNLLDNSSTAVLARKYPSRFLLMFLIFLLCFCFTFKWETYKIHSVL